MKTYQRLASLVDAHLRCLKNGIAQAEIHEAAIRDILRERMPSGSGVGSGTSLDWGASTGEKIVLLCAFHPMTGHGCYGWTAHKIIVTPSLAHGFKLQITGRDRNGVKDYLYDLYWEALMSSSDC